MTLTRKLQTCITHVGRRGSRKQDFNSQKSPRKKWQPFLSIMNLGFTMAAATSRIAVRVIIHVLGMRACHVCSRKSVRQQQTLFARSGLLGRSSSATKHAHADKETDAHTHTERPTQTQTHTHTNTYIILTRRRTHTHRQADGQTERQTDMHGHSD